MSNPGWEYLPNMRLRGKTLRRLFRLLDQEATQREYRGILDGTLDFYARSLFLKHIAHKPESQIDMHALQEKLMRHYKKYPASFRLPVFLDNHDTNRFLFECNGDRNKLKRALAFMFSLDQPVILYYGTEAGLVNENPVKTSVPFSDLGARGLMDWTNPDPDMAEYIRMLAHARRHNRTGS